MKLLTLAFLVLLAGAHASDVAGKIARRPLSMLRDGEHALLGYCCFAMLLLIGALMLRLAVRLRREEEACVAALAAVLLAAVAATPSDNGFHLAFAILLLLLMYAYFGVLLHLAESPWLFAHLVVPALLVLATRFHSYGLWQKALIVYFVLAINVRFHVLQRQAQGARTGRRRRPRHGYPLRRPVVYAPFGKRTSPTLRSHGYPLRRRVVYLVSVPEGWTRDRRDNVE